MHPLVRAMVPSFEKLPTSKEEEYFYRLNRELIEERRRELDKRRLEQRARYIQSLHWMKCPKCGNQMQEINLSGIIADQCTVCSGVFFDQREIETLLEAKIPKNFLKATLKRIRARISQVDVNWRP